jgi:hypothetical protein
VSGNGTGVPGWPSEPVTSENFVLTKRKFGRRELVSPEVLDTVQMTTAVDQFLDGMLVKISMYVLTDRILTRTYEVGFSYPANPWQHLKARFAPRWFRNRWPVAEKTVTNQVQIDVDAIYPNARIRLDEHLGHVVFHESASEPFWAGLDDKTIGRTSKITYGQSRHGRRI